MTSIVMVKAHCPSDVEVIIEEIKPDSLQEHVLQDGEEGSFTIYGDLEVAVFERKKT